MSRNRQSQRPGRRERARLHADMAMHDSADSIERANVATGHTHGTTPPQKRDAKLAQPFQRGGLRGAYPTCGGIGWSTTRTWDVDPSVRRVIVPQ